MQEADPLLDEIASYALSSQEPPQEAKETARLCLADAIGCMIKALSFKACTKLLGPIVPGTVVPKGARVLGTDFILDPFLAAFNTGALIRWLDFNDTFLAKEWGHPSDNLGALLPLADWISHNERKVTLQELLLSQIKAYEIQGVLQLGTSFNRIGIDHVILVKIATAATSAALLGGSKQEVIAALSNAFIDYGPLRTYRHAPNAGFRKSWAAADQARRGLEFAWECVRLKEMGYPYALSGKTFGFFDAVMPIALSRPLGSYIMENILFKVSFPAEFHAQTAVEAAIALYPQIDGDIETVEIETHEAALRIIAHKKELQNPADRDHSLEYMVAIALLFGDLKAEDYEEERAKDPNIEALRKKMVVRENPQFSKDYLDPEKRSIASSLTVKLKGGKVLGPHRIDFPLGHKMRRLEAKPLIVQKFKENIRGHYPKERIDHIAHFLFEDQAFFESDVSGLYELFQTR